MDDLTTLTNTELIYKYGVAYKEFAIAYSRKKELEEYIKNYDGLIAPDKLVMDLYEVLNDFDTATENKKAYDNEIRRRYKVKLQKSLTQGSNEVLLEEIEREKMEELLEAETLPF